MKTSMERRLRQTDEPRKLAELLAILLADSTKTRLDFTFTREDVSVPIGKNIHVHVHYTDGVVCDPEAN